jgi:SNF2 family DNA or RNA helicase
MSVIVSKANQSLIVPAFSNDGMFPGAVRLDLDHSIVPHGMRETLLLRHMGYKVPNPMGLYYDWPHPEDEPPFKVQTVTSILLSENPRAYVLNDMGTGKTRTVYWTWDFLYQQRLAGKMLVVCKLSNLRDPWTNEAFKILPGRKVNILHGSRKDRLRLLEDPADIYVINYGGLRVIYKELLLRKDITCLVLDELAMCRNNSDRTKLVKKLAKGFATVWGLSGSPIPNAPTDVYHQVKIVTPSRAPDTFRMAQEQLMTRVSQYVWRPKLNAIEAAYSMMQPAVRFPLDAVTELPDAITRTIEIELSKQQETVYAAVKKDLVAMIREKRITALNAGAAMNKLLQISLGWVYNAAPEFVRLDASPRIGALIDLIESSAHKVIVMVPYRHAIEGISGIFDRLKVSFDWCMVHGDTKNRHELFTLFQNTDKYHVMLAHPECISHGLTLTAADTVIWTVPTTSYEVFEQANARIRRVGQRHKQQFLLLQATPVERHIYRMLERKELVQDKLLALFEEASEELI